MDHDLAGFVGCVGFLVEMRGGAAARGSKGFDRDRRGADVLERVVREDLLVLRHTMKLLDRVIPLELGVSFRPGEDELLPHETRGPSILTA